MNGTWTAVEKNWERKQVVRNGNTYTIWVREVVRGPVGWEGHGYYDVVLAGPRGGRPHGKFSSAKEYWKAVDYAIKES